MIADAIRLVPHVATSIEMDNLDPTFTTQGGSWGSSKSVAGYVGSDYQYVSGGNKTASFTPTILVPGEYEVFANWTSATSRATNAPVEIVHAGGTTVVPVD
uniref:golvesin C-terminal-like domain-containing protein n=1 Tax=Neorhodopirellula lusitana TaxID=445327 RepID=UPI00384E5ABB